MIHIGRCVADSLEKGNKRPAKEQHAAVWVPDGEAARCMACARTQFNLVQRRHHCRACGRVICGACSTHSYRIDSLNKKLVRVCDMANDIRLHGKAFFIVLHSPQWCDGLGKEMMFTAVENLLCPLRKRVRLKWTTMPTFYREEVGQEDQWLAFAQLPNGLSPLQYSFIHDLFGASTNV
nr:Zinc finger domain containing protein [Haemonchus contortus]